MTLLRKHTTRDKRLLALEREANRLYQAKRDAPIVPLARPYQKGWIKTFALTPEVLRRPDVEVFRTVLLKINTRLWARTREFLNRHGEPLLLRPRVIGMREWNGLRWPASHRRLLAFGHWELGDTGQIHLRPWFRRSHRFTGYTVHRPWWLREDVQPHLITHQRVNLPDVESRLAEIETELQHTQGRHRLSWLHGRRVRWRERKSFAQQCEESAVINATET
jgi:hypothetical protein